MADKHRLDCALVQDLLPSYIDGLTSPRSTELVAQHLAECADCRAIHEEMLQSLSLAAAPAPKRLRFLSKMRAVRIIAAVACALFALAMLGWVYSAQYPLAVDRYQFAAAIAEQVNADLSRTLVNKGLAEIDPYVLEMQQVERGVVAFFRDVNASQLYGFAHFAQGLNGGYQISGYAVAPIPYTAAVFASNQLLQDYVVVGGFNCLDISAYGIQFADLNQGAVQGEARYPVENAQFLTILPAETVVAQAALADTNAVFVLPAAALYDQSGEHVSDSYFLADSSAGWGTAHASQVSLPILQMILILLLGAFLVVYILR